MKKTKRQINSLIVSTVLTMWITLLGLYYGIFILRWDIINIENKKEETKNIQLNIERIKKKWLSFAEFDLFKTELSLKWGDKIPDADYILKLIEKSDEAFYIDNYTNTGTLDYIKFIKTKGEELKKVKTDDSTWIKKDLKRILPNYSSASLSADDEAAILTDFKFINYLETLFYTFNLKYNWSLWIKNIVSLEGDGGDLETSIYYIPLDFNLVWKKRDIINFIYFFQNVWYVKLKGETLSLYKDDFISNRFWNKILLNWSEDNGIYNIYNNQLADIESLELPEYLDSWYKIKDNETSFIDFIREDLDQANEEIKISIWLRFFTVWAENYKIKKYINDVIWQFTCLSSNLTKKIQNPKLIKSKDNEDVIKLRKLKKLNEYIMKFKSDVDLIRKDIWKAKNLSEIYKEVRKYEAIVKKNAVVMDEVLYDKETCENKK